MSESPRRRPWWQWLLAAASVIYLVGGIGWGAYYLFSRTSSARGPSEMAVHPERAGEIMARERAEQLRQRLGLTEEQTQQVTRILQEGASGPPGPETMRRVMEQVRGVLTPEQQQRLGDGPGALGPPPGAPGGPRGGPGLRMDIDRIEKLETHVPPELQERFKQRLQEMRERRSRWGGPGGGPGGPPGGPPGVPPGGPMGPPPPPPDGNIPPDASAPPASAPSGTGSGQTVPHP
ncbi:MAG TPA: hypothetical protein PLX03_08530 [Candidatus Hydrogenedentes bacterium]|nr:hypothetical protein [Candidatus Hydrogenedentota bacterium]